MTKNGMKVLDSDMHLMEPVDLWQRYVDAKFTSEAPRAKPATGSSPISCCGARLLNRWSRCSDW